MAVVARLEIEISRGRCYGCALRQDSHEVFYSLVSRHNEGQ